MDKKFQKKIQIKEKMFSQRIDNYLFKNFKNIPKSAIYKKLRMGKIKINGCKKKPTYKLKFNDKITIYNFFEKITEKKKKIFLFLKNILKKLINAYYMKMIIYLH